MLRPVGLVFGLSVLLGGCSGWSSKTDSGIVFEQIFQTPIPAGVCVHNAVHYEYNHGPLVEEWQWFVSFTPDASFEEWLLSPKSYRLQMLQKNVDRTQWLNTAPSWFAPSGPAYEIWQTADGSMSLVINRTTGVFFMTDYAIQ